MDNYEVLEVIHTSRTSENANMTIFTKSFLKSQFKECSVFYNA